MTAQDLVLGGVAFLKLRPAEAGGDELLAEARLLADLSHPRLVRLVDVIQDTNLEGLSSDRFGMVGKVHGFATEWIDGEPFVDALVGQPLETRIAVFGGLLDVVDYLHRRQLLHLDLKPSNVLGSVEQGVTLLDLGSARPLDGGPGEAGGTLGYAAPEVLARQAASVMSDIYSLGALLYELVTGARPHGELEPRALRQACLAGDVIPVRAVAPDVPRPLATLIQDMLHMSPPRRPRSVEEVRERLGAMGFLLPRPSPGAPPFVGRERELSGLSAMLSSRKFAPIALIGPSGSGRSRLARRALHEASHHTGIPFADLSRCEQPLVAIHRILTIDFVDLPPPGSPGWLSGVKQRLTRTLAWRGLIYLGALDALSPQDRATLESLLPELAGAGQRIVVACERILDGARALPLGPLGAEDLEAIGHFLGVPTGPELTRAVERSAGLPGNLIRQLAAVADPSTLPAPLRADWEALVTLPAGLDALTLSALPPEVQEGVAGLRLYGLAFDDGSGRLQLVGARSGVDVHPTLQQAVRWLIRSRWRQLDALWAALAAARVGEYALAAEGLEAAVEVAGPRRGELIELAERLVAQGSPEAVMTLARIRMADADPAGALEVLGRSSLTDADPDVALLSVRALRLAGRLEEAEARARAILEAQPLPWVQVELARLLAQRGATVEACAVVAEANAADAEIGAGEGLAVQVSLLSRRYSRGEEVPELRGVLRRVQDLAGGGTLPPNALAAAGRTLAAMGEVPDGVELLERAIRGADRGGDLMLSAVTRLNLGNILLSGSRGREARRVYAEALRIARATDTPALLIRLSYSLATLELRRGRLPAAETHIAEFKEIAARLGEPEAEARAHLLDARLSAERARFEDVCALLEGLDLSAVSQEVSAEVGFTLARARFELGRPEEALATLEAHPAPKVEITRRQVSVLRGRIHIAVGRRLLADARQAIEGESDPIDLMDVGEVLLRAAGEDLDPESFQSRRDDLDQAAKLLHGSRASQAATLRDRLLVGPGAALEGIVELTEAMNDPQAFPGALGRLVAEALGAHRVLIMLKLPGLGQQMTYQELAGEEAAGIGQEVLTRIAGPDDTWQAADAFADPALREASATVRTFQIKSLLAVAIPFRDRAIGALYVDDLHRANRFTDDDVRVLKRLAAAVGRIIALIPLSAPQESVLEPTEVFGVMLRTRAQVEALEDSLELLHEHEQANLLVTGPTGAGKTVFARRVAEDVLGLEGLVELAVRQMDPQMLVSALTGTRRGEFTGAITQEGVIQKAIAGRKALFIDEIQSLDEAGQQILLPLLELPTRRFGGLMASTQALNGRLHIILGTNADVSGKRWSRHFRDDLWYRMSRVHVHLPTLAERGPEAVYRYLSAMLREHVDLPPEQLFELAALHRVTSWEWPGNLRELNAFASKAATLYRRVGKALGLQDLPRLGLGGREESAALVGAGEGKDQLVAVELDTLLSALRRCNWVQADAARLLGITRWTMHRMLRKHDLVEFVRRRKEENQKG
ncbi:MAG: sigma 54-interacting transcriptional regulator [Alphaproteobacteria bacterium]|nr:sigma 54-interacting transcriptional regulator [Alphaproteobacteria bacterium]MCB9793421.1 sigma 54-interacting transcriptional regulator [Alphaproteobacteria bacterium]